MKDNSDHREKLEAAARACESVKSLSAARDAADAASYAARYAASAARYAASYAADAASYAARYAASAASDAADAASYAASDAASAARYAASDAILTKAADVQLSVLIELNSPGCEFLSLLDA